MEKGYTPGCVSVVFVLAIGFFIGRAGSGGQQQDVMARLDQLETSLKKIQTTLSQGVSLTQAQQSTESTSQYEPEDYEQTKRVQKSYQHVEPDWDQGADPSVPAELGGRGFIGEGWQTKADYNYVGDPRAQKGGQLRVTITDFPATFRPLGAKANTVVIRSMTQYLMYESLLFPDPLNLESTPLLATHWKEEVPGKEILFRINPSARWSDGMPVVAQDVVESVRLYQDPGIGSPGVNAYFNRISQVQVLSKYLVKFIFNNDSWRNMMICSYMFIYPAHVLEGLDGAQFLSKFQFKFLPGTGPYQYDSHREGSYIQLKRQEDYWGQEIRSNIGTFNFNTIKFIVLSDPNTAFEALKKGDLDILQIGTAQRWVEQTVEGKFAQGLIQKRRIFNREPVGTAGLAFNMRRPPFNNRDIRLAFAHMVDFETMNDKFFFDQYIRMDSYFDNGIYEYKNKKKIYKYDPDTAREYLARAGWKDLNQEGYLEKEGEIFSLDVPTMSGISAMERIMVKFQQDMKSIGVKINLMKKAPTEIWKIMNDRQFDLMRFSWNQTLYPAPEHIYHSKNSSQPNTNNLYGLADPRVDQLCDQYEAESDREKRTRLLQKIDQILYEEIVPAALWWYPPYARFTYHSYLSHPSYFLGPYSESDFRPAIRFWWHDPEKRKRYDQVLKEGGQLPIGKTDVKYWLEQELN